MITSFAYSAVGHGGATAYIMVFALSGFDISLLKSSILVMNMVVAGTAFIHYKRYGYSNTNVLIQLIIFSASAAFIGASIPIDPTLYRLLLGLFLIAAGILMLSKTNTSSSHINSTKLSITQSVLIGTSIGFLAGILGIGGGIILSPILIFYKFCSKKTASISALFILINSSIGLLYLASNQQFVLHESLLLWVLIVWAFALLGSYIGARYFPKHALKKLLGLVVTFGGIKTILT